MDALVFGNVTLDIICYPVNDVPRHESISFDDVMVSPGGCGSNTAIGLAALGIPTGIVTCTGDDDSADLLFQYWQRAGVDSRFVQRISAKTTGTSVGLIDDDFQPRFYVGQPPPGVGHPLGDEKHRRIGDHPPGLPRRSGPDRLALEDQGADPPPAQVVGDGAADDARSDDDDVLLLRHCTPPALLGDPDALPL